jgi:argininosuccinate lyase
MQETQEPLFDAASTANACVRVATGFMRQVAFNYECMQAACESGFMNALAAATYLVRRGVPFRQAHEIVAHAVQKCAQKKCELSPQRAKTARVGDHGLEDLSLGELREFSPAFGPDIYQLLKLEAVLACHDVAGGTAPERVREAIHQARERLGALHRKEEHVTHA